MNSPNFIIKISRKKKNKLNIGINDEFKLTWLRCCGDINQYNLFLKELFFLFISRKRKRVLLRAISDYIVSFKEYVVK